MLSYSLRNIIIGYSIAVVVVLLILFFTFFNLRSQEKELARITKAREILQKLEPGLMDIQEFKSDMDNLLFFGKEKHPDSHNEGVKKLQKDSVLLAQLADSYPEDREEYRQLVNLIHEMTSFSAFVIRSQEMKSPDTVINKWPKNSGDRIVSKFKSIVYKLEEKNRKILSKSYALTISSTRKTLIFVIVISIVLILVLLISFLVSYRDVKYRLKFEDNLANQIREKTAEIRESEEKYRSLIEQASDGIIIYNLDGTIYDFNQSAYTLCGYTREEFEKITLQDLLDNEDLIINPSNVERFRKGETVLFQRRVRKKDGTVIDVEQNVRMMADGKLFAFARDITYRKKMEEALIKSELYLRGTLDSTNDGILAIDNNGKIITTNNRFAKLWNIPQELIGLKDDNKLLEYVVGQLIDPSAFLLKVKELYNSERTDFDILHFKDSRVFERYSTPLILNQNIVGRVWSFRDITEQKKGEEEFRQSNDRFEMITRTTNDAVWDWDLETGKLWGNEMHQHFYGLTVADPVPGEEMWIERIHPDDRERMQKTQAKALASQKNIFITEYCFLTEENGYRDIYDRCYIIRNPEGKAVRMMGSMMDITERKKAEELVKESEEKYRNLIEQASDPILIYSTDGRIMDYNNAFMTSTGYQKEDVENLKLTDFLFEEDLNTNPLSFGRIRKGISVHDERRVRRKDGSAMPVELNSKMMPDGNFMVIARDITDRKKTEEDILKTNARFQVVSKATSDIVWDWDFHSNSLWWNDNYYSLIGIKKEKEITEVSNWYDSIHPDDLIRVSKGIEKAIHSKETYWTDEYRFLKADGTYFNFLDRGYVMRDQEGKAYRMIGSMVNMTPVYTAQREVAESENRLRTIFETEPECIKLLGPKGELLDMNPAGLAMIEADNLDMVKGTLISSVVMPRHRNAFDRLNRNVFKGKSGILEFEIIGLKGTHRWMETNAVPLKNADGKIISILGVTRDITERKKAEQALKENEEKYRTLVEQAVDAIALYDASGKVLDVNTGCAKLLGYSKEELVGMSLNEILTKEEIKSNPVRYDVLQQGVSTVKQRRMIRKDGTTVETEVRSQQLPDGRFLSVIRDLTERIRVEKDLAASYKAIRQLTGHLQDIREDERAHIAREIHDELGQQLTVMKMDISWLKKRIKGSDDEVNEKLKELLLMLDGTVKSVRRISSELRPSLLDDLGLVAALEWQLTEFEKRSGIATSFVYAGDEKQLPDTIKTALFRIVQESLTNVARHSGAKKVTVTFTNKDDTLFLSIADNGKGFDKQKITDKRTLGILGMKERVNMINGVYKIKANPGNGTEVLVQIPMNKN